MLCVRGVFNVQMREVTVLMKQQIKDRPIRGWVYTRVGLDRKCPWRPASQSFWMLTVVGTCGESYLEASLIPLRGCVMGWDGIKEWGWVKKSGPVLSRSWNFGTVKGDIRTSQNPWPIVYVTFRSEAVRH